jgi:ATP-dependent Clp protease ATP-binding subunit ClpC
MSSSRSGQAVGAGVNRNQIVVEITMFERFTERARKVMALANQQAQSYGHEYIGTEHMLLGLLMDGWGVGANLLRTMGANEANVRAELDKLIKRGPDTVAEGKLPMTPRAKAVVESAILEARNFSHHYVGTEHLLLGMLDQPGSPALAALASLGLQPEAIRKEATHLLGAKRSAKPAHGGGLSEVVQAWEDLSEDTRAAILDLVKKAKEGPV